MSGPRSLTFTRPAPGPERFLSEAGTQAVWIARILVNFKDDLGQAPINPATILMRAEVISRNFWRLSNIID